MKYITSYQINPDRVGDLHYDDWHTGYSDCHDRSFPQHIENQAYMDGWLNRLGMQAGYANLQAVVANESFIDGYKDAQYERHCHNQETVLDFEGV